MSQPIRYEVRGDRAVWALVHEDDVGQHWMPWPVDLHRGAQQMSSMEVRDGELCERCQQRPATENLGHGLFGALHGLTAKWCLRCCTEEQLAYARARAADIPRLEAELARLNAGDTT